MATLVRRRSIIRANRRGAGNILSLTGMIICAAAVAVIGLVVGLVSDLPDAIRQSRDARIAEARSIYEAQHPAPPPVFVQPTREAPPAEAMVTNPPLNSTVPEPTPAAEQPPAPRIPIMPEAPPVVAPRIPIVGGNNPAEPIVPEAAEVIFSDLDEGLLLPDATDKPVGLARIHEPKNSKLTLKLISAKPTRGEGFQYSLQTDAKAGNVWTVAAEAAKKKGAEPATPVAIARLEMKSSVLEFQWLGKPDASTVAGLRDCGLLLEVGDHAALTTLKPTDVHPPLDLDFTRDSMSVRLPGALWDDDDVTLNVELISLQGGVGPGLMQTQPATRRAKLGEPLRILLAQGDPAIEIRLTLVQKATLEVKVEPLIAIGIAKPAPFTKARVERLARTYGDFGGGTALKNSFDQFSQNATLSFRVYYARRKAEAEILRYGERAAAVQPGLFPN